MRQLSYSPLRIARSIPEYPKFVSRAQAVLSFPKELKSGKIPHRGGLYHPIGRANPPRMATNG